MMVYQRVSLVFFTFLSANLFATELVPWEPTPREHQYLLRAGVSLAGAAYSLLSIAMCSRHQNYWDCAQDKQSPHCCDWDGENCHSMNPAHKFPCGHNQTVMCNSQNGTYVAFKNPTRFQTIGIVTNSVFMALATGLTGYFIHKGTRSLFRSDPHEPNKHEPNKEVL